MATKTPKEILDEYYSLTTNERHALEACEQLRAAGWKFDWYSFEPAKGWWILPNSDDPVKAMRRGDPKPLFGSALTTIDLYCPG